jgi:hypothetical protein
LEKAFSIIFLGRYRQLGRLGVFRFLVSLPLGKGQVFKTIGLIENDVFTVLNDVIPHLPHLVDGEIVIGKDRRSQIGWVAKESPLIVSV